MPVNDPVMDVVDKLPLTTPPPSDLGPTPADVPVPFGARLAVAPVLPSAGKHEKTYYTVTYTEATQISDDGKVVTIQDQKEREEED
jgi:hypothetical protein